MKNLFVLFAILVASVTSHAQEQFPIGPDHNLTPGSLCSRPSEHRYPEGINYCERDVDSDVKRGRFAAYDQLGFRTRQMDRQAFKIDHYIPLCMGGSNNIDNLWPQHKSVYEITDSLEQLLCQKMAEGKLLQKDAVRIIVQAKNNLDQVPAILARAYAL
ncbi:HNH endonuclease signature motif containing protein [Bdellovibrio sp. KM01]|uniref:HNH endonuclease signature motif containing protein n=1 Tax=Bdellovibrio sp. KM01 TaxID=2748865 RepID=UPI0015E97B71|nr:HNH endonuclease signature motif containing protein [Bdellovibrio sp. KM01]QLY27154.1 hypothetical protein HW988_09260 [Bdellovibrio sp. KM01]